MKKQKRRLRGLLQTTVKRKKYMWLNRSDRTFRDLPWLIINCIVTFPFRTLQKSSIVSSRTVSHLECSLIINNASGNICHGFNDKVGRAICRNANIFYATIDLLSRFLLLRYLFIIIFIVTFLLRIISVLLK